MICKCKIAYFDKVKETTHLSVIQQIQHQKKMGMGGGGCQDHSQQIAYHSLVYRYDIQCTLRLHISRRNFARDSNLS